MKGTCETISHPRGEATGREVPPTGAKAVYREVICPVCGKVQGIRRTIRNGNGYLVRGNRLTDSQGAL